MAFFAYLALLVGRTLTDGWAVWMLWGWFVAPLGAPSISFWHACGLDLFVGLFFAFAAQKAADRPAAEEFGWMAGKMCAAALYVGIGWVILQVMR